MVVIGVGNPDRGDDGAGRAVARGLRAKLPGEVDILEHDGEATSLLARLENVAAAYLIDACASGAPAGTVRRFDVASGPLPSEPFSPSSHGFGLAEAIELARALGQLPPCCIVYAIEAASLAPGEAMSPAVETAVEEVAQRVREEVSGAITGGRIGA